jgi:hypothetical protein
MDNYLFENSFRSLQELIIFGDYFLQPSLKYASFQKDPSLAFEAFEANIGAHSYHLPLVAAAGMRLAQPNYIASLYIHDYLLSKLMVNSNSLQISIKP